jgi:hypothetical protein
VWRDPRFASQFFLERFLTGGGVKKDNICLPLKIFYCEEGVHVYLKDIAILGENKQKKR